MESLKGKTALITGGSRGIGAGIAKVLASHKVNIAFTYIKSEEAANQLVTELSSLGVKALAIQTDAADVEKMQTLPKKVLDHFGSFDILINNADSIKPTPFMEISNEDIERTVNFAIKGPLVLSREAAKIMGHGSRIINIASVKGEIVGMPNISLHVMGKAAWVSFAKSWAHDLASKGITVNAIQPGPITTDMNPGTGEVGEYNRARTAFKRYGTVEDIGNMVAYLTSDKASYITGSVFNVDGGFNA